MFNSIRNCPALFEAGATRCHLRRERVTCPVPRVQAHGRGRRFRVRLRVYRRSAGREVVPQCGFNSHSLVTNEMEYLSDVLIERLYFLDRVLKYFAHYILDSWSFY